LKRIYSFLSLLLIIGLLIHLNCKKEYSCENCNPNKSPVADAGADKIIYIPQDSVLLDGSASSDPDGTIIAYFWSGISGPGSYTISNNSSSLTYAKKLIAGTYRFMLRVTDNAGLSASDTINILVVPDTLNNRPPEANAGPDQSVILPANTVTLDGSASTDPDNNITSYAWSKISGPSSFNITNAVAVQTQVKNLVQGDYQFELTVTDAQGLFAKDTMKISVTQSSYSCGDSRPVVPVQVTQAGSLSVARHRIAVASAGEKIFFAGGSSMNGGTHSDYATVDIFNTTTQTTTTTALSIPRADITAIAAGNKIFFAGGKAINNSNTFVYYSTVDIYDVVTGTWSVTNLSEPRGAIAAAAVGNKVLFAGGSIDYDINFSGQPGISTSKVDIYDLNTQTWSTASLSEPRDLISAATAQDKVYFAGGGTLEPNSLGTSKRIDIYDEFTGSWTTDSLMVALNNMACISTGDKIFWAGGGVWPAFGFYTCSVAILDVNTNSFTEQYLRNNNYWTFNGGQQAVIKNNKIAFCNGGLSSTDFDIYNLNSNTWETGRLPARFTHNQVIKCGNEIYFAGGYVDGQHTTAIWKMGSF